MSTRPVLTQRRGPPASFGWLRRSCLDRLHGGVVWEQPDGRLYIAKPGSQLTVVQEWG